MTQLYVHIHFSDYCLIGYCNIIEFSVLYRRCLLLLILYPTVCVYVNPKRLMYPSSFPFCKSINLFSILWVYFCFVYRFICIILLGSIYRQCHMIFVFVWLTSLSMKISVSIHVAAHGYELLCSFYDKWQNPYSEIAIHYFCA